MHRDHDGRSHTLGELERNVLLASAQERRGTLGPQRVESTVENNPAFAVLPDEVVPVQLPERREQALVDELRDRVCLLEAVLERGTGEREHVARVDRLEHARRPSPQALRPLRLVHDQEIRRMRLVVPVVAQHLLVVGDEPARPRSDRLRPIEGTPLERCHVLPDPATDLVLPAAPKARRTYDRDRANGICGVAQSDCGEDGLDRLAETHLVGEECAAGPRQELRTGPLVWVGLEPEPREVAPERSIGQGGAALDAAVEPGECFRLHPRSESFKPTAQLRFVLRERAERASFFIEAAAHTRGTATRGAPV